MSEAGSGDPPQSLLYINIARPFSAGVTVRNALKEAFSQLMEPIRLKTVFKEYLRGPGDQTPVPGLSIYVPVMLGE